MMKRNAWIVGAAVGLAVTATVPLLVTGCGSARYVESRHALPQGMVDSRLQRYATVGPIAGRESLIRALDAPPGGLPALDEEVWVIVKLPRGSAPSPDEIAPGCGALVCCPPGGATQAGVPLPLEHTGVRASISGYIASVEVTQQFRSPYHGKIEAVYVFPLPENAAVSGFVMTIGERRIRGIIREREEAEEIYQAAKHQGYVASLLTQERPNVFTQRVANIEPGRGIDVEITYFHTLVYDDGWYEFVFPMVVGPRFNPPGSTEGVGAVGRGRGGASGQATEVQYLRPGERSGHDISLEVKIQAGMGIEEVTCRSHRVDVTDEASEQVRVGLRPGDAIPNKDFVLRYRLAGDQVKTALMTHRGERGNYFAFMLCPPQDLSGLPRQAMEMIFVLDCSGSMQGKPLKASKAAIDHALGCLGPQDTFQVIRFSDNASQLGRSPLPATPEELRRGRKYVAGLRAGGGTMMSDGIRAALDAPHDGERLRFVTFLTDGYVGNDVEILAQVRDRLGEARIFSFGVGSAPNRYLMDGMAKMGRGAVAYLGLREDGDGVMDRFFRRISHPVLTDIEIDWGGLEVEEVIPRAIPDLFVGRPVVVAGRFRGSSPATLRVRGRSGERIVESRLEADPACSRDAGEALASIWARMKIAELADLAAVQPDPELEGEVTAIALEHTLVSAWTSFVAVDAQARTHGRRGTTVAVPVPVPDGVSYETTVEE